MMWCHHELVERCGIGFMGAKAIAKALAEKSTALDIIGLCKIGV